MWFSVFLSYLFHLEVHFLPFSCRESMLDVRRVIIFSAEECLIKYRDNFETFKRVLLSTAQHAAL
jgi:hypothetical protein